MKIRTLFLTYSGVCRKALNTPGPLKSQEVEDFLWACRAASWDFSWPWPKENSFGAYLPTLRCYILNALIKVQVLFVQGFSVTSVLYL